MSFDTLASNNFNRKVRYNLEQPFGSALARMGNTACRDEEKEADQSDFRALSAEQRAATFDERRHLPSCSPRQRPFHQPSFQALASTNQPSNRTTVSTNSNDCDFRPLQRAATYDPRLRAQKGSLTVSDVMYRRYFNVQEQRTRYWDPKNTNTNTNSNSTNTIPTSCGTHISLPHPTKAPTRDAIVIIDPFSTGQTLAEKALSRGYACICVYSDTLTVMQTLIQYIPSELKAQFLTTIVHDPQASTEEPAGSQAFQKTVNALESVPGVHLIGILAGAETGVMLADALSEHFQLGTNGTSGSLARRNKYLMGEKVREAGLRAIKQRSVTKWSEIQSFLQETMHISTAKTFPKVIVKPVQSAGSDDVTLCTSLEMVQRAFGNIQGKINSLGLINTSTLVQEFVEGTEYVVDTVSRDGKHKVVAVWEYDKRQVNNAPFVYFGVKLHEVEGEPAISRMIDYILRVLDALEIRNGPAHAEVKLCDASPCLIEIGARCHGGEGAYISMVNRCIGYNQVECTLDAYFDAKAFDSLPDRPPRLRAHGSEAVLVSYEEGILEGYPGLQEIRKMPSHMSEALHVKIGDTLPQTIDMFTNPGSILMVHEDSSVLERDYKRIRELEYEGLYRCRSKAKEASPLKKIVVVVDPFSTGAVVAHQLMQRGYECICVYSDRLENIEHVASLIPEGLTLSFTATIPYEGDMEALVSAIQSASGPEKRIDAVLPGAELGVLLADAITDALNLRGNRMEHSPARRDKYLMGETLREAGIRSVKQVKAETWSQAQAFIQSEFGSESIQIVLKPLESAGTEDVIFCSSMEQAKTTFASILGKINGLGIENRAVLVQEFLEGNEYVIDTVSLDGTHKVTAIWKYDKRRVNDAAFVYFGLSLIPATGNFNDLITYQFQVLDALGIRNGPAHGEVKFCREAPVLIEVGARCHGGEGAWIPIANQCVGYNQVDVTIDAFLEPEAFYGLPDRPRELLRYGCEVMLVSYKSGILEEMPGIAEVKAFPSFLQKKIFVSPGDRLYRTIDMFTTPGSFMLSHSDRSVLEANVARIRELEHEGMYRLKEEI